MGRLILVPIFHSPSEKTVRSRRAVKGAGLSALSSEYFRELGEYLESAGQISKVYCDSYLDFSELGEATQRRERTSFFRESEGAPANSLILSLEKNGAEFIPTEDPSAFFDYSELASSGNPDSSLLSDALYYRDLGIIERVGRTLGEKETGVLLIGAIHKIRAPLTDKFPGISIVKLPFSREYVRKSAEYTGFLPEGY